EHAAGRHPRPDRRADRGEATLDERRSVPGPAGLRSRMSLSVAVLVSGEGSNLQAILDQLHGRGEVEVVGVASNRPAARGLERARAAGVEAATFDSASFPDRAARDHALGDWLEERGAELIVLAGFMELLGAPFIRRFRGRIINVHPSLLPAFPGVRAIEQALD